MVFTKIPVKTIATAPHWAGSKGLPYQITDSKMVKNLRDVVTMVVTNDPNSLIVKKMNSCGQMSHNDDCQRPWKKKSRVTNEHRAAEAAGASEKRAPEMTDLSDDAAQAEER
jgi:hypothetical protein